VLKPNGQRLIEQISIFGRLAGVMAQMLKPLGDRVVIRPAAREEVTRGGLVLPDTAKEKPQEGTVVAVGTGRVLDDGKRQPLEVKEGDTVVFAKYSGTELKLEDEDYLIIRESDILAIKTA
jgi:chaperonin GroES